MNLNDVLAKLEATHKVIPFNEDFPDKEFWLNLYINQKYFEYKGYKRKPKQFLVLTGRQLEAAQKLIKFIPFVMGEKYPKDGYSLLVAYIQQAVSMMFFEPICDYVKQHYDKKNWVKIEDIILNDPFNYELSESGAKKWFNRNYPRTFNERNVTNMPIPDGCDEWPMLRCSLYSFGSFNEVRIWNNND